MAENKKTGLSTLKAKIKKPEKEQKKQNQKALSNPLKFILNSAYSGYLGAIALIFVISLSARFLGISDNQYVRVSIGLIVLIALIYGIYKGLKRVRENGQKINLVKYLKNNFNKSAKTILILVAAVIITFLVTVGVLIYGAKNDSPFVKGVARVVPYPAAVADWRYVSAYSYLDQVEMLKNYYREYKGTDFSSDEGKDLLKEIRTEVIDRLIEDQLVAKEAKRLKITVSKEEVDKGFNDLVTANGGEEEFASILNKYYNLTMDEFKTKIYRTQVLREKVAEAINNDQTVLDAAKAKADEVYAKTQASGADFAKLANEYSGDTATAASGGDLGYFKKGTMVTEFENVAFALKKGEISKPVKTVYGYHIIKLVDIKGDQIKASHILIKVRDYTEWLENKKEELKAKKYLGFIPGIWKLVKTN